MLLSSAVFENTKNVGKSVKCIQNHDWDYNKASSHFFLNQHFCTRFFEHFLERLRCILVNLKNNNLPHTLPFKNLNNHYRNCGPNLQVGYVVKYYCLAHSFLAFLTNSMGCTLLIQVVLVISLKLHAYWTEYQRQKLHMQNYYWNFTVT